MEKKDKTLGEQLGWSLVRSSYLYESQWFKLRQDELVREGEGQGTYTYIEHPGSVFVVPLTEGGLILLIRSYRFTLDSLCWEIPAGTMAGRNDLAPKEVAIQELQEELGAKCRSLQPLGKYYLGNGHASHPAYFFLALDVQVSSNIKLDAFEQIIEAKAFSFTEVARLIENGIINDGDSAFALLLALNSLANKAFCPEPEHCHDIDDSHKEALCLKHK